MRRKGRCRDIQWRAGELRTEGKEVSIRAQSQRFSVNDASAMWGSAARTRAARSFAIIVKCARQGPFTTSVRTDPARFFLCWRFASSPRPTFPLTGLLRLTELKRTPGAKKDESRQKGGHRRHRCGHQGLRNSAPASAFCDLLAWGEVDSSQGAGRPRTPSIVAIAASIPRTLGMPIPLSARTRHAHRQATRIDSARAGRGDDVQPDSASAAFSSKVWGCSACPRPLTTSSFPSAAFAKLCQLVPDGHMCRSRRGGARGPYQPSPIHPLR